MIRDEYDALVREHKRLMVEDIIIDALLKKVRREMNKYEIERLQLESMMLSDSVEQSGINLDKSGVAVEDGPSTSSASSARAQSFSGPSSSKTKNPGTSAADMDSVETINQTPLDLNVSDSLLQMIQGKFYNEEEEEEEDDDDEEWEEEEKHNGFCFK